MSTINDSVSETWEVVLDKIDKRITKYTTELEADEYDDGEAQNAAQFGLEELISLRSEIVEYIKK